MSSCIEIDVEQNELRCNKYSDFAQMTLKYRCKIQESSPRVSMKTAMSCNTKKKRNNLTMFSVKES